MIDLKRSCKDIISIALRWSVRTACKAFFVFPVQQNKVFFSSFAEARDYNCNPKYITEYLNCHFPGRYDLVWQFMDPSTHQNINGVRTVKYHSLRWFYELLTARVLVANCSLSWLPRRNKQYIINTWHAGGAYKRVGKDVGNACLLERWRVHTQKSISLFLSSSAVFTDSNIRSWNYIGEVMKCGMPRNDIFFDEILYQRIRMETRCELGIEEDEITVLYAPTFRKERNHAGELGFAFPVKNVLTAFEKRYDKHIRLIVRAHHADTHSYTYDTGTIDASDYEDMQRLLCAADILITDYSSSMWDFALTGKPCLLYVPDLQEYIATDRGFYTEPETWPGILCEDTEQLIHSILSLDEEACATRAKKYLTASGSYETGHACEQVGARIQEVVGITDIDEGGH